VAIELESATFEPYVGETFRLTPEDGTPPFDTVLESCEEGAVSAHWLAAGGRVPFSLLFRPSAPQAAAQGTFALAHDALGTFELVLVPIAPQPGELRYEAIIA
jgi:hypothetical protein